MGAAEAKKDGVATVARMKAMPVEDDCFGKTTIREDGRNLIPAYLFEVKKPSESKGPWDYYKLVATTPGDEAYRRWPTGTARSSRPNESERHVAQATAAERSQRDTA